MLLTIMLLLPLLGALIVALVPREEEGLARGVGYLFTIATFILSIAVALRFKAADGGMQLGLAVPWVPSLGISFKVGIDGISLWLVLLTTFLTPICLLSAHKAIDKKVRGFVAAFLILETGMLGAFVAQDLFLFYVFWEVMLVPMYFIIGVWGGDRRIYASFKFVIYTMVGSLLMLVAIFYLYVTMHDVSGVWTFDMEQLRHLVLTPRAQIWCFLAFASAFFIKVPMFPAHTWLPDAHVQAPTAGSVILAGVLLKFGIYGFLRFAIPLFPWAATWCSPGLAILAVIGIVYGSLVAFAQDDMKRLVAYSSVAHMGFVMLGVMAWNAVGIQGAIFTMLSHGLTTGGLFLAVGVLYDRRHKRDIAEYGGIAAQMPRYAAMFMICTMGSIGLPALSGFVGEFMSLLGMFNAGPLPAGFKQTLWHSRIFAIIATTGVVLGAVYMLWMFQKVMFGKNANPKNQNLKDLSGREVAMFLPLVVGIFWLGLFPKGILNKMDASVRGYLDEYRAKMEDIRNFRQDDASGEYRHHLWPEGYVVPGAPVVKMAEPTPTAPSPEVQPAPQPAPNPDVAPAPPGGGAP